MDLGASSSSQSAMRVNQGPHDSSLLFRQDSHRSRYVYNGDQGCNKPLTCRRADTLIWEWIEAASNGTKMYIELYGFGPASRIGRIFYDWSLITSLVERWRPETHTFHLPFGETSITLQDVEVLFGLKIDGEPITGYTGNEAGLIPLCQRLLGFTPNRSQIVKGRLKFSAIKQHIRQVPVRDGAPGEMEEQRARCLILWLLGGLYFADSTTNRVPLYLLQFLGHPHESARYSWGSAVLALLYKNLCDAALSKSKSIYGCLLLVQVWAWERISTTRPMVLAIENRIPSPGCPLASIWRGPKNCTDITAHNMRAYRDQLAVLQEGDFNWTPYDGLLPYLSPMCTAGRNIWRARTWLICFEVVEAHLPDRVMRQFRLAQPIPSIPPIFTVSEHHKMHTVKKTGRSNENWAMVNRAYVHDWNNRHQLVVQGNDIWNPYVQEQYMKWYHKITILTITNPADNRVTSKDGFQGSAEGSSALVNILEDIRRFSLEQRENIFEDGFNMYDVLTAISEMAQKGIGLNTTQPFYGDPSQTFVAYDPTQSQMIRTDFRPRHAPRGGVNQQGFREPRQRPQQGEDEDDDDEDDDDEDDDDDGDDDDEDDDNDQDMEHHDQDMEQHDQDSEQHDQDSEQHDQDRERTPSPSPCLAERRPRREPHPKKFYGDSSSGGKKKKWYDRFGFK